MMFAKANQRHGRTVGVAAIAIAFAALAACSSDNSNKGDASIADSASDTVADTGASDLGTDTGNSACTATSASCFVCTAGLYCQVNAQYCLIIMSRTGSTGNCVAVPSQCLPTPTCGCVGTATNCQQSAPGALTVTSLAP
jgi:hypothetical protein